LSPDRGKDTIAWVDGLDHLLRNGVPVTPSLADVKLSVGAIVFVSQAAPEYPVGNARAVAPARFVALPSIAYRLARAAAGDGVAAVSLNGPCGWDYAAATRLFEEQAAFWSTNTGMKSPTPWTGRASQAFCFGGGSCGADLVTRDWHRVRDGLPVKPRTVIGWPRRASEVALDRAVGCLLGQIIGDLGSLVEFRTPNDIAPVSSWREEPRRWRDLEYHCRPAN
jgi:hypothetical protein